MNEAEALNNYVVSRDPEAFKFFVNKYQSVVYSACKRILNNSSDIEDATQETFVQFSKEAAKIRENIGAWIYTCAFHTSLKLKSSEKARKIREQKWAEENIQNKQFENNEWHEIEPLIDGCINELQEYEKELIVQYYFLSQKKSHMADKKGISQTAVKKQLDKAILSLRNKFKNKGINFSAAIMTGLIKNKIAAETVPAVVSHSIIKIGLVGIQETGKYVATNSAATTAILMEKTSIITGSLMMKVKISIAALTIASLGFGTGIAVNNSKHNLINKPDVLASSPSKSDYELKIKKLENMLNKTRIDKKLNDDLILSLKSTNANMSNQIKTLKKQLDVEKNKTIVPKIAKSEDKKNIEKSYSITKWNKLS